MMFRAMHIRAWLFLSAGSASTTFPVNISNAISPSIYVTKVPSLNLTDDT